MLDVMAGTGFTSFFRLFIYITSVAKEGRGGEKESLKFVEIYHTDNPDQLYLGPAGCRHERYLIYRSWECRPKASLHSV